MRHAPRSLLLALLLAASVSWPGCAVNPATGKKEFTLVSESQEIEMGRQADVSTQAEYGLYPDDVLAAEVERVGQKLAAVSERPGLEWHFRLLDSPVVNAFALPGGYIYITRGILATLNSEAQLAGVLGHEIGHVTARHSVRQATRSEIAGLGLGLGTLLVRGAQDYAGALQQGLGLLFLKYSRGDEDQADELGVRYVTRAGYDPREMPATYRMLQQMAQRGGSGLPTFLSTHPDPGARAEHTGALAAQAAAGKTGLVVRSPEYKRELANLVYGDDPRQGYLSGSRFYHPALRFQLDFPAGWQVTNSSASVTASAPGGASAIQMTLAQAAGGASPEAFVASLQQAGKIAQASGAAESIGGHAAWVGSVSVPNAQGGNTELEAAWVARGSGSLLQLLGSPGGDAAMRAAFRACARSLRDLDDPARLNVQPARVKVQESASGQALASLLQHTAGLAVDAPTAAWLNGLDADATVPKGFLVKLPVKPQ